MEVDALGDPEADGEPFERDPLGAVPDHRVAQRRMALAEHRERAQDVGVALARDQMRHRDERLDSLPPSRPRSTLATVAVGGALCRGEIGAEMHHARLTGAVSARELGDAVAVGEHQRGRAQAARHRVRAGPVAPGGIEHVPAMHRYHHRRAQARDGAPRRRPGPRCARG